MNAIKIYLQLKNEDLKQKEEDCKQRTDEEIAYQKQLINLYNNWFVNVKQCMSKSSYRRVLGMIHEMPKEFDDVYNRFDIEFIRLRCIVKIIEHKTIKYEEDYKDNRLKEKKVIEFWMNQLYFAVNHLILEIRPDLNDSMNLANEQPRNQIENTVMAIIDSLYRLIIYSLKIDEIAQTCAYMAMANRLEMFVAYCRNPKTLQNYQKIALLRVKLLIKNKEYDNAISLIEKTLSYCFRQFFLLIDFDEGLNADNLKEKKKDNNIIFTCFAHMIIAFYYRGICNEEFGRITKGVEAYKQCNWICKNYLSSSNALLGEFFSSLLNRSLSYSKAFSDIVDWNDKMIQSQNKVDLNKRLVEENESKEKRIKKALLEKIAKGEDTPREERLEKALQLINKMELKDIEISHNKKYPKSQMLTSTVKLIDYLLCKSFRPIIKGMKTLEINSFDGDLARKIKTQILNIQSKDDTISTSISTNRMKKRIVSSSLNTNLSAFTSSKGSSSIVSSPSLRFSPNKVERITIDSANDKDYRAKKNYLEQYNVKELKFHKSLLKCKISEISARPEEVNQQFIRNNAEIFFKQQLLVSKERESKMNLIKFDSQKEFKVFDKDISLRNKMIKSLSTKSLDEYQKSFLSSRLSGKKTIRFSSQSSNVLSSTINREHCEIIKKSKQ